MIEVKLQGEDAARYIRNESLKDAQIEQLIKDCQDLMDQLEKAKNTEVNVPKQSINKIEQPTNKVNTDTEKLKSFTKQVPKFCKKKSKKEYTTGAYTDENIIMIHSRMNKSENNKDRSLAAIAGALNRSESSVRTKLLSMNIRVENGMCFYK